MAFHPTRNRKETLVVQQQNPFALLTPKLVPARPFLVRALNDLSFLDTCTSSTVTAIDFETKGNDPTQADTAVVGIGLANQFGSAYFTADHYATIIPRLHEQATPLIAHNLFFDASWVMRDYPRLRLNWLGCTYAAFRMLATEGFPGQEWGLKYAQKNLLLWKETNETELDNWLVHSGYYTSTSSTAKDGYVEHENRWYKPAKGEMWRAPVDILGKYCALDAESTWLFYTHILVPALMRFSALSDFLDQNLFTKYILEHVRQKLGGVRVDRGGLQTYQQGTNAAISQAKLAFLSHPAIQQAMAEYDAAQLEEHASKEPPRYKKDGNESVRWKTWESKRLELSTTRQFNMNSGQQRQWLFYDALGFPVRKYTESGQPAVDGDALTGFGEIGKLLITQNDLVKEDGFITQLLSLSEGTGRLHGNFRIPGTLTGRLSANSPNLQQLPKSPGLLSTIVPDPGHVFVDCDHSALEQVVLAELSKDKSLFKLYGPGAKANDVYLFVGAQLPVIGKTIRDAGYDPENPTPETIAAAKKVAKSARGIAKTVVLASSYGAGGPKIAQTLRMQGVDISDQDALQIHAGYWELFAGVKAYQRFLEKEYRDRGGWILNGIGRPIGVFSDYTKDLVNRACQSTGADIHTFYCMQWMRLLEEAGIPWRGIVICWHDQAIIQVEEKYAEQVKYILGTAAYTELNKLLHGVIPIRGEAQIVRCLAEAKVEGYKYASS